MAHLRQALRRSAAPGEVPKDLAPQVSLYNMPRICISYVFFLCIYIYINSWYVDLLHSLCTVYMLHVYVVTVNVDAVIVLL